MEQTMRPARLALALLVPGLFLTRASGVTAQAGGAPTLAIKSFQFVHAGHIYQSGASIEAVSGSGTLELGVYSTTGQTMPNVSWRMKTANGSFDSGPRTAPVPAGPSAWTLFQQAWPLTDGTTRFIAVVTPPAKPGVPGSGLRGPSAELMLTVRLITYQQLRPAAIPLPPAALVTTTLENPSGHCRADPPTVGAEQVQFVIRSDLPAPAGFTGCALVAQLFRGVGVGNGWTVSNVLLSSPAQAAQPVWEVEPSKTSLAGRLRIPVTPSQAFGYSTTIRITLKGPPGTQPTFIIDPLKIR